MKNFSILEHTADTRLFVEGSDLNQLFLAAAEGMNSILKEPVNPENCVLVLKQTIKIEAPDSTALLVDFLSTILTISQTKNGIFSHVGFKELTNIKLDATVEGFFVEKFDEDIKAVTYHEAEIRKSKNGNFETIIVFDI
jgi:SHS2 domain-containing protein